MSSRLTPSDAYPRPNVPRRIVLTLAGAAILAVSALVIVALWLTRAIDDQARADAERVVAAAIQTELERIELIASDYAFWEAAHDWVAAGDDDALYENFGTGATDSDAFDRIFVLAPDGTPLYAYATGGSGSDPGLIDPAFARAVRDRMLDARLGYYELLTGFVVIDGTLMAAAAARILPDASDESDPLPFPILVGARALDDAMLTALGQQFLLDGMAHWPDPGPALSTGQSHLALPPLLEPWSHALAWNPPKPGDALWRRALPIILGSSFAYILVCLIVGQVAAGQARDILTERSNARTDQLTGLVNRTGLAEIVAAAPFEADWRAGRVAVIFLDLNGFKSLNDSLGHKVGDAALRVIGDRLAASVRRGDIVARIGGDEFLCVVCGEDAAANAREIVDRILLRMSEPFLADGSEVRLEGAIGVALAAPDMDWDTLVGEADTAMYASKQVRPSRPVFAWEGAAAPMAASRTA